MGVGGGWVGGWVGGWLVGWWVGGRAGGRAGGWLGGWVGGWGFMFQCGKHTKAKNNPARRGQSNKFALHTKHRQHIHSRYDAPHAPGLG